MIPDRAAGKFGAINANRKYHGSEDPDAGVKTSVFSSSPRTCRIEFQA
jgi:hypothetical protein